MSDKKKLICHKCKVELVPTKTFFNYLGHNFNTDVPCCPVCGEVYIDEKLVRGRMTAVEQELEDK